MEKNTADGITFYLALAKENTDDLACIRHWTNIKVGFEENSVWVKDLNHAQVNSLAVKSLPFKNVFYEKNNKLFLFNSSLPDRIVPSLLWTPVDRALPIKLPPLNHNYFGIDEQIDIRLIEKDVEVEASAMITSHDMLRQYIAGAPAIRLKNMRWVILPERKVLLLGKPLLPIPGNTYWQQKDFLIPAGYDFELWLLTDLLQKKVNPARDNWVLWNSNNTYSLLPKEHMQPLSQSSFRLSFEQTSYVTPGK